MRTLKFTVNGQNLQIDPTCDFTGLVPGLNGYLQAEFNFSNEWGSVQKVVSFHSRLGKEYPPQVLKDGKTCIIPSEALKRRVFKIRVFGKNGLVTNKLVVDQKGGSK